MRIASSGKEHSILSTIPSIVRAGRFTRATVPNHDLFLAPGQFARLSVTVAPPAQAALLPDSAVVLDQSQHLVMTVAADGIVTPRIVQIGELRGGLRVIRSGLEAGERVIVDGLVRAIPGTKVAPQDGAIRYDAATDGQGQQG